jgi:acetyl-CoA acetyltransferase
VSGRGVLVGFTVNEHMWSPAFPPPYVVGIVAIDEDPRVRLTTNIVDVPTSELAVGRRVEVRFEQHEDVWLPMFTLASDGPEEGPIPPDDPPGPWVRPMVSREKFEDKVALTGIGMSRVGRRLGVDPLSLAIEACRNAVADAGLTMADIDGLSTYPGIAAAGGHSEGGVIALEESLRIRPTWFNGGAELPGQAGSVVAAMLAVAAGLCRHVLCFRTVWESTWAERVKARPYTPAPRVEGDFMAWRTPFGALSAVNWIAMNASNHFHQYGTTRAALGTIAVNNRQMAGLNPMAIYRDPITMDDYFNARMISSPFGLFDCDVPCDGSVALVVSAADVAPDMAQPPVYVEAVGTQIIDRVSWDQGDLSHEPQTQGPAAHLWSRTSLRQEDVDFAQLYDGFTFNCLGWIEGLGFCGIGEAGDFLADPSRIALGGQLPLNTFGGQLSAGRTHGYGYLHEAVVQLRGDGGDRQVAGAQVGVVSTGGGTPGGCFLFKSAR